MDMEDMGCNDCRPTVRFNPLQITTREWPDRGWHGHRRFIRVQQYPELIRSIEWECQLPCHEQVQVHGRARWLSDCYEY
jgi:hypothetical protein